MTTKAEKVKEKQPEKGGVLFSGIVNVCGESDVGKTTFALESGAMPDRILFIDDDVKGQAIANDMERAGTPFGKYVNLVDETSGMKETEFHQYCIDMINAIEPGRFDVIIWDTFTRFEKSFHPWVLTHQNQFRERWSPSGVIHGSEIWITAQQYEATVLDILQTKAPLVIVTSHMKDENLNGIRTGKRIPDCMKPVIIKSTLRIMFRHSDNGSPIPTGLVLKRIGKRSVTENGIETISVLPRKVPNLNWAKMREFWNNPVGNRPLQVEEMPNEFEMSLLDSSVLTDDQRLVMQLSLKGANTDVDEENDGTNMMKADMKAMVDSGKSYAEIASTYNISVKDVIEVLKQK